MKRKKAALCQTFLCRHHALPRFRGTSKKGESTTWGGFLPYCYNHSPESLAKLAAGRAALLAEESDRKIALEMEAARKLAEASRVIPENERRRIARRTMLEGRIAKSMERKHVRHARAMERERVERERVRVERERVEREEDRLERERMERERVERDRLERERMEWRERMSMKSERAPMKRERALEAKTFVQTALSGLNEEIARICSNRDARLTRDSRVNDTLKG